MTTTETFAQRFKVLRNKKKDTLKNIAEKIGVTAQSLSLYETGKRTINIEILKDIAKYFNVSADYLIGLTDCKTTDTNLEAVCEYTGLTESSIQNIKNYDKHLLKPLNMIFESYYFRDLLIALNNYYKTKEKIDSAPKSRCICFPDPLSELSPEEEQILDAKILLEDCGFAVLTSDYEILDYYYQQIGDLLMQMFGRVI